MVSGALTSVGELVDEIAEPGTYRVLVFPPSPDESYDYTQHYSHVGSCTFRLQTN